MVYTQLALMGKNVNVLFTVMTGSLDAEGNRKKMNYNGTIRLSKVVVCKFTILVHLTGNKWK